jgi:hypothetical protein
MLLALVFATVSLVLALRGETGFPPDGGVGVAVIPSPVVTQTAGLLRYVVFGVVAGVAFFSGLACFFWSAVVEARQQRAEIIRILERAAQGRALS